MKLLRYNLALIVVFYFSVNSNLLGQELFINEFMASNSATITDPHFNNYADWIEIYNSGSTSINLKDYYITDNLSQPQKFKIQNDLIVESGGYVLIWADDANTCLLYTSDAADERSSVDLGGRRIIKKKKKTNK